MIQDWNTVRVGQTLYAVQINCYPYRIITGEVVAYDGRRGVAHWSHDTSNQTVISNLAHERPFDWHTTPTAAISGACSRIMAEAMKVCDDIRSIKVTDHAQAFPNAATEPVVVDAAAGRPQGP